MVRERLNAIDIAAVVKGLETSILGYNLTNIYDVTNRVFVLKFSRHEDKIFVLFEIGMRIHATAFQRTPGHLPSNFTAKLRKHLRARRLSSVQQLGQDRIVDFCFSCGVHAQHLVVQLFLPGNVYLTDCNYTVIAVLRQHHVGESFFKVGQLYELPSDPVPWDCVPDDGVLSPFFEPKKSATEVIKSLYPSVPGGLIEWAFKSCDLLKFGNEEFKGVDDDNFKGRLKLVLEKLTQEISKITRATVKVPGFVLKSAKGEAIDYSPFNFEKQRQGSNTVEYFDDYNAALDSVFTSTEIAKQEKLDAPKKPKKLDKIKLDQDRRALKLNEDIQSLQVQVELLADNYKLVDDCINLIRALLASGASWKQIEDEIEQQGRDDHPVAKHIHKLDIMNKILHFKPDLSSNAIAKIDFGLSCHQNLEALYAEKKKMELKLVKTQLGRDYALRKVSKEPEAKLSKSKRDALQKKKMHTITKFRRRLWFEKFHWFITSDGFMVLGGKDSMQNELLVKRYMTNGDLYFHADVHGASSCILKNPKAANVPEASILETGCFAQCHSSAWDDKHIVQSWWVYWHQVSKSAPSGEYVPSGSFVIRGKKNFVPPQRLEMGLVLVFHVPIPLEPEALALGEGGSASGDAGLPSAGPEVQSLPFTEPWVQGGALENGGIVLDESSKPEEQEDTKARRTNEALGGLGGLDGAGVQGAALEDLGGSGGALNENVVPTSSGASTTSGAATVSNSLASQQVQARPTPSTAVKFLDPDESCIIPVEVQDGEFKRTKCRRPTGYPHEQSAAAVVNDDDVDPSEDLKRVAFCNDVVAVEFPASNLKRCKERRPTGFAAAPIEVGFEDMSEDDFKSDTSSSDVASSEDGDALVVQDSQGSGSEPSSKSGGALKSEGVALEEEEEEASDDDSCSGSVTFSKEVKVVVPIEADLGDFKRTRSRRPTGYPRELLQGGSESGDGDGDGDDTLGVHGFQRVQGAALEDLQGSGGASDETVQDPNSYDTLLEGQEDDDDSESLELDDCFESLNASGTASDDIDQDSTSDENLEYSIDSKSTLESLEGLKISSVGDKVSSQSKVDDVADDATTTATARLQNKNTQVVGTASKELHLLLDELKVGYSGRQKSRRANAKLAKARKKYGLDDIETQRLRLLLTGSKVPSGRPSQTVQKELHAASGIVSSATSGQRRQGELRPLDETELETCMHECLALKVSPSSSDGISAAIPMCAPYSCVKSSKWHVKLVPGTMKKGSIASSALAHFVKQDSDLAPFVRLVTTDELVLALINNAKVA